ncbi:tetratricopeptide repeat protein [Filimonas effusa]|uniref:Uncharacterized protein n=1 Tax=Filimonas effusa TaxID=2508721 RepID=A0A4Q1DCQ8_9BACT|nr:tetratricopeptide repeat protein [Filimonas effusa]RXK87314.1 hypothetical protein ESB13_11210 [Filimonas effusa]
MKPKSAFLYLLLIAIVTFVTYVNHFDNSFHFDDSHTIENNLNIRSLKNIPGFFSDGTTMSTLPSNQSYRPLLVTTLAIDFFLGGSATPQPFMFHVTSFVIFLSLGFLCYMLFLYFLQQSLPGNWSRGVALFVTAWFLLHPANAETVNYIIARSDLLSAFFIVAAFVLYIYHPAWRKSYLYVLPVLLGLLVKEQTVMFVPLFFLYKFFFEENLSLTNCWKQWRKVTEIIKSILFPVAVITIFFLIILKVLTPQTWRPGGTDLWKYILTQPFVIFHYCCNFILPVGLVVDTDWKVVGSYTDYRVLTGLLFIALLVFLIVITSRRQSTRPIAFGIAWFLLALAPTSLMPLAEVLNDHRTFFPYIGLFIAMAVFIRNMLTSFFADENAGRRKLVVVVAVFFLAANAWGTWQRNQVWDSDISLWKEATIKAAGNGRAWMNYGVALMAKADFNGAESCFIKTTQLWPAYPLPYTNLGILKQYTGKPDEAEANFSRALAMDPHTPANYSFYAKFLTSRNRFSEADALIAKGLAISPGLEDLQQLRIQNDAARKAQGANSDSGADTPESLINASLNYYNGGDYLKCIEAAQKALVLRPGYDLAYVNICAAYNRLQQYDKAIAAGEKGLQFNKSNRLLKGNLAEAYAGKASMK